MALTLERIEALAPDQPSLAAARKLLKPGSWPTLAVGEELAWGECQGSGATPYRVVVSEADSGYKCTCPSRKFPCKHALALMWMRAEGKAAFVDAPVPEWVKDWLGRRRGTNAVTAAVTDDAAARSKPSIALIAAEEDTAVVDPKAEARAAAARERNRLEREAAILGGLDDLDTWLTDQVERGIAGFVAQSSKECRSIAQRLIDAKASGLATRLDALPTRLFTLPEPMRPMAAVQELGQIHLISAAYRLQGELPPLLLADVRQAVGWSITRDALFSEQDAVRAKGIWHVVASLSEVQPDRLRRVETWLLREPHDDALPRVAVLMDFVPVGTGAAASGYIAGDRIEAELIFYPSTKPLRAQIVSTVGGAQHSSNDIDLGASTLEEAYARYEQALGELPWLGSYPLIFSDARVRRNGENLFLCDRSATLALPFAEAQATTALPLAGLDALDGFALWNGYSLTLCWAHTSLGRWVNA